MKQQTQAAEAEPTKPPADFRHLSILAVIDDYEHRDRQRAIKKQVVAWLKETGVQQAADDGLLTYELTDKVRIDRINRDHALAVCVLRVTEREPTYKDNGKRLAYVYTYEVKVCDPVAAGPYWNDAAEAGGIVDMRALTEAMHGVFTRNLKEANLGIHAPWPRPCTRIKDGLLSWRYS